VSLVPAQQNVSLVLRSESERAETKESSHQRRWRNSPPLKSLSPACGQFETWNIHPRLNVKHAIDVRSSKGSKTRKRGHFCSADFAESGPVLRFRFVTARLLRPTARRLRHVLQKRAHLPLGQKADLGCAVDGFDAGVGALRSPRLAISNRPRPVQPDTAPSPETAGAFLC